MAKLSPCGDHLWSKLVDDGSTTSDGLIALTAPGFDTDRTGNTWLGATVSGGVTVDGSELSTEDNSALLLVQFGP